MNPLITVIASAYNDPFKLMQMVCNFRLQTNQNFILHIVHDGYNEQLKNFIYPLLTSNMIWTEIEGPNGKGNYVGRNQILDTVTTPYVMFASDDNYYANRLFDFVLPHLETQNVDFLMFKCVHDYFNYIYEKFCENMPVIGGIDLCQFIVKTHMVLEVGKFETNTEETNTQDGQLCERIFNKFTKMTVGVLPNCLLVHN